MSKDRLEEFIQDNRNDFDSEIPSLNIFSDIEKELGSKKKSKLKPGQIARRSAAVIALLAIACCWVFMNNGGEQKEARMNESPLQFAAEIGHPELTEMSEYYTRKINSNKGKLAALNHHDPDLYRDLHHMEAMYDTLAMEWSRNPHKSDEKLVNAMIANFRTRSTLLENVVTRVEGNGYSIISARPAVYKH